MTENSKTWQSPEIENAAIDDSEEFETLKFPRGKTQNECLVRCGGGGV